mgnify:CR=1 FL=1
MERLEFPVIENFSPEVPIEIYSLDKPIKVVATVDTGSEGFLQVPLAVGIKANLRLFGTRYWVMADGRKVKKVECIGKIRFAGKDLIGIISLSETSEDCLLGMQFLQKLGMDFTVSPTDKKAIFSENLATREKTKSHEVPKKEEKEQNS